MTLSPRDLPPPTSRNLPGYIIFWVTWDDLVPTRHLRLTDTQTCNARLSTHAKYTLSVSRYTSTIGESCAIRCRSLRAASTTVERGIVDAIGCPHVRLGECADVRVPVPQCTAIDQAARPTVRTRDRLQLRRGHSHPRVLHGRRGGCVGDDGRGGQRLEFFASPRRWFAQCSDAESVCEYERVLLRDAVESDTLHKGANTREYMRRQAQLRSTTAHAYPPHRRRRQVAAYLPTMARRAESR